MNHPTVTKTPSGTGLDVPIDILGAFIDCLRASGYSASQISTLRLGARHFLTWLCLCDIAVASVDNAVLCAFRRHDCHCPDMERERRRRPASDGHRIMTGALKLVRFLEDQGCIPHPGELDANLRRLDGFIARCKEEGYGLDSLQKYRSSCRHILTWLHQSHISITEVDTQTLERFRRHDCICPGPRGGRRQRHSGGSYEHPFRRFLQHLDEMGTVSVQLMTANSCLVKKPPSR